MGDAKVEGGRLESLTFDQCMVLAEQFGDEVGLPSYGHDIRDRIECGKSFLFPGRACFIVLTPVEDSGLCVHIDIACSKSGVSFIAAINWVIKKGLEIGADYVTFHTKNVKLERIAHRLGWQNCGVENGFSKWKFEARQSWAALTKLKKQNIKKSLLR